MKYLVLTIGIVSLVSCQIIKGDNTEQRKSDEYELLDQAKVFFQPLSEIDIPEQDPDKVKIGKYLFYDTRLSEKGNISCNSCHNLKTYGVDNLQFSPGDSIGSIGVRNSPTVLHAALHKMQFWDGRAENVEEQAEGPILNPIEHDIKNKAELVSRLKNVQEYNEMFSKAYGSDGITFENIKNAIGAFERTLMPESRFDKYLEGDLSALNKREKKGLSSFINSACITCHNGVALGGQMYQKFGLNAQYWKSTHSETIDLGLYEVTQDSDDKYFFKVPGLRNVAHTGPYFHDGSVADLEEAVEIMGYLQTQVDLSKEDVKNIVSFLESLSSDVSKEIKQSPFKK